MRVSIGLRCSAFQFDAASGRPFPAVEEILASFSNGREVEWSANLWFASPNGLLDDRRPADVLPRNPETVLAASIDEIKGFNA